MNFATIGSEMEIWVKKVIIGLLIGVLVIVGAVLWKVYVIDGTLDKDGMINPEYVEGEGEDYTEPIMLDGDYTYVNNEALLQVIAGTWKSSDDRYALLLSRDYEVTLLVDGESVLEDTLQFTYLQPGPVSSTEFQLNVWEMLLPDGTNLGEINFFYHEAGENDGKLVLEFQTESGIEEKVEFAHVSSETEDGEQTSDTQSETSGTNEAEQPNLSPVTSETVGQGNAEGSDVPEEDGSFYAYLELRLREVPEDQVAWAEAMDEIADKAAYEFALEPAGFETHTAYYDGFTMYPVRIEASMDCEDAAENFREMLYVNGEPARILTSTLQGRYEKIYYFREGQLICYMEEGAEKQTGEMPDAVREKAEEVYRDGMTFYEQSFCSWD